MKVYRAPTRKSGVSTRDITFGTWISIVMVMVFWVASALGLDPNRSLDQYSVDSWTEAQGLPQNSVQAVLQSRDGYLWIATQEGLARFDGTSFTIYDRSNSEALGSNHLEAMVEGSNGYIWIGTIGGGLSRLRDGEFRQWTTDDGLSGNSVGALLAESDGSVWIGTFGAGIDCLRGTKFTNYSTKEGLPDHEVRSIFRDHQGRLWVGTAKGIAVLEHNRFQSYSSKNLPPSPVNAIAEDLHGNLWIGTDAGLGTIRGNGEAEFGASAGLPVDPILALYVEPREDGRIWVGTTNGLLGLASNTESVQIEQQLSEQIVNALYEDREGSLWVGTTTTGLSRLTSGRIRTFSSAQGLSEPFIYSVAGDGRTGILVGTQNGEVHHFENGRFELLVSDPRLRGSSIRTLLAGDNDTVWIGNNFGLFRHRGGNLVKTGDKMGLPERCVRVLTAGLDGSLWIGTESGGVHHYADGHLRSWTRDDGLANDQVRAILCDKEGNVWVGTYGGLGRLKDGTFTTYTTNDGLSTNSVRSLYQDGEGTLWIGTYGGGLNWLRNDVIESCTTKDGLFNDVVFQILPDDQGRLWLSCNRGIFGVNTRDLEDLAAGKIDRITCTVFGKADGMRSRECNGGNPAGFKTADGLLWFATTDGLVMVDPSDPRQNRLAPQVVVEKVIVDGLTLGITDWAQVPRDSNRIEIHYTALSLFAPEKNRFAFQLEGYDRELVDAGGRRVAHYTNLPPGNYCFRVTASNGDGVWNTAGASLEIDIRPYFYETRWFTITCISTLALFLILGHRLRVHRLKRRQDELEHMVAQRTCQLEEQAQRLEELNEKKNELLGIASHDLRSPLASVISQVGLLQHFQEKGEKDAKLWRKFLGNLRKTSEQMRELVDGLLDVAAIESGRLEISVARFRLTEVLHECADLHNSAAQSKGIDLQVECQDPHIEVEADRARVAEVLDNLVVNAIKFTWPKGKVRVHYQPTETDIIVHVEDTGQGLEESELSRAFSGKRLSARPTGGETSTGFGLVIVRKILDLHGCKVWVNSTKSKGSTFSFNLPRADRPLPGTTLPPAG